VIYFDDLRAKTIDGLASYGVAIHDIDSAKRAAGLYERVVVELGAAIRSDDACRLALPASIEVSGRRAECLVVILTDRLVVAWKPGGFRKAASLVIPFAGITAVYRNDGLGPERRRGNLLVIEGTPGATIVLPVSKADTVAALIRTAIGPSAASGPRSGPIGASPAAASLNPATLLAEARQFMEFAGQGDRASAHMATERIRRARQLLDPAHTRDNRLLVAEATELNASMGVAFGDDFELGIATLAAAASLYLEGGQNDETRRDVARVCRILAGAYASVGMRERAAIFAIEYLATLPDSDRDPMAIAYTVTCMAAAGKAARLDEFVRTHDPDEYPEPLRSLFIILAQRAGHRERTARELAQASRQILHVSTDLRLQCVLFAANALIRLDEPEVAAELLTELRDDLGGQPLSDARVAQVLGDIAALLGDAEGALRYYLLAWTRYDDLRYMVGATFRRAIEGELVRARRGALAAAARQHDWSRLLELIESCRLQASFNVVASATELDEVLAAGEYEKPSRGAHYFIDRGSLPQVFEMAAGDVLDSRADVTGQVDVYVGGASSLAMARAADGRTAARPRLDANEVMRKHARPEDFWWSSWHENGVVYWVLSQGSVPVDGGTIDLSADEALREALSIVCLRYHIEPSWPVPASVEQADLTYFLAEADTFEELQLTSSLARVLPPAVREPGDPGQRLFISCAPELAAIPWPILPVGTGTSPTTRLVERFELRFAPSLALLRQLGEAGETRPVACSGDLPFLLTCDYFPDAKRPVRLPARRAQTILAARELLDSAAGVQEATVADLSRVLRSIPPGLEGVAFFRTHYAWVEDNLVDGGIALADGILLSGMFGAHDRVTGQPIVGLPSTVVMSCCSTSGNRARNGGESLGLAPLAMMAGARRLIVTSVEIRDTAFTVALDDMLIDIAVQPGDHFAALRALQLRLLSEWRLYSLRNVETLQDTTPTPDIWGHYLAYGA
jgi:hypothetical protein